MVLLIINDLEYASNKIQKKRILNKYFRVKQRDVKNTFSKKILFTVFLLGQKIVKPVSLPSY